MLLKPWQIVSQATPAAPRTRSVDRSGYGSSRVRETSQSGEEITPEISLTVPGVLAAFTILCEDISSLPLVLYERLPNEERERAVNNPYYALLHDEPNPEMTSMLFRELMMGHLLAWGNFYAQIVLDQRGNVAELWPLRPDRMTVLRVDGQKMYHYLASDGKPYTFLRDELLHIPAFGFDGLVGYSRIALARNSIGLAISAEKYGSKLFANDARPAMAVTHPGDMGEDGRSGFIESYNQTYKGADNAHKFILLEEGMDIKEIGFPPEDVQFVETQRWTVEQIARVFRVPPHMIGDVNRSTSWGTGIDSQEQGYVNHTLRPWTVRIEQSSAQQMMMREERRRYYWEHLFDALVRGDLSVRYGTYVSAINNGIMNPNEVRKKENMPSYPGGEIFTRPLNTGQAQNASNPDATADAANDQPADDTLNARTRPLFLDAAARILRREENELRDASQRWNAKGKPEKYTAWVEQFYKSDFPAFALATLQPLMESQLVAEERVHAWLALFCESRGELALASADLPVYSAAQFVDGLMEIE